MTGKIFSTKTYIMCTSQHVIMYTNDEHWATYVFSLVYLYLVFGLTFYNIHLLHNVF